MKANIKEMFKNWNETLIWSCLQGVMGEIHTNSAESPETINGKTKKSRDYVKSLDLYISNTFHF